MRGKQLAVLTLALFGLSHPVPLLAQSAPAAAAAPAATLEARVRDVLAQAPQGTRFGLLVTTPDGTVVVSVDPDGRFIPASNTKLFTTAVAFATLPRIRVPDQEGGTRVVLYPVRTPKRPRSMVGVQANDPLPAGGVDVALLGYGDARMSSRADCTVDCLATLVDAVAAKTRRVRDVGASTAAWPDQRWSPGMSWNNIETDDGAANASLNLDDNRLEIVVTPTVEGRPPLVNGQVYFTLRNEAVTVAANQPTTLRLLREVNGTELRLVGRMPVGTTAWRQQIGIDDPARYAAIVFKQMLEARGVRVTGEIRAIHRPVMDDDEPAGRESYRPFIDVGTLALAQLVPPPLAEDIVTINKFSNNLHAQILLRRIGDEFGTGSQEWGLSVMRRILDQAGIPRTGYDFSDGSGMSTYNRVSPRATVGLLRWAQGQPWGAAWRASFPIGGTDGTLRRRFVGTPLAGKVWAKTGTLNATNALAGYLTAASGRELVFAIYANDVPDGANAVPIMDAAIELVAATN